MVENLKYIIEANFIDSKESCNIKEYLKKRNELFRNKSYQTPEFREISFNVSKHIRKRSNSFNEIRTNNNISVENGKVYVQENAKLKKSQYMRTIKNIITRKAEHENNLENLLSSGSTNDICTEQMCDYH